MQNMQINKPFWGGQEVLITGGTGSLGKTLTRMLLSNNYKLKGLRLLSRGEAAQWKFKNELMEEGLLKNNNVEFLIGDIRDYARLSIAMRKVNIVIHTAALKHIELGEKNPIEVIETNIHGTKNVLFAVIENKIDKAMLISTDKAVNAVNLYGMTKAVAEKIFIHGNVYSGNKPPYFSCCRYGNVLGSRGSVVPLFKQQKKSGKLTITSKDMSRFWITLPQVSNFLLNRCQDMKGKEIFIPKMPSAKVIDIARIIAPEAELVDIGIGHGEKLHETLISIEESKDTILHNDYYEINPGLHRTYCNNHLEAINNNSSFTYTSDKNTWKLDNEELSKMIEEIPNV